MQPVLNDVCGSVLVVASACSAWLLYRRLSTRRGSRISQVISAPAAFPVRSAFLLFVFGAWLLAGAWPVLVIWAAIIAWELIVQATALVRRRRHRASTG
jgi:hypothetical protein